MHLTRGRLLDAGGYGPGAVQGFGMGRVHLQVVDDAMVDHVGLGGGHADDPVAPGEFAAGGHRGLAADADPQDRQRRERVLPPLLGLAAAEEDLVDDDPGSVPRHLGDPPDPGGSPRWRGTEPGSSSTRSSSAAANPSSGGRTRSRRCRSCGSASAARPRWPPAANSPGATGSSAWPPPRPTWSTMASSTTCRWTRPIPKPWTAPGP